MRIEAPCYGPAGERGSNDPPRLSKLLDEPVRPGQPQLPTFDELDAATHRLRHQWPHLPTLPAETER
jgi:hypothetical protein